MERTQYDWQHDYIATPQEFNISANEAHSTYDQFIQLRDTLIFSGKYYNDKRWAKLIVGDTCETIEVEYKNWMKMSFEPDYRTNPERQVNPWDSGSPTASMTLQEEWGYVTWLGNPTLSTEDQATAQLPQFVNDAMMAFKINKDWHYLMFHKEEILLQPWSKKVYCFLDYYKYEKNSATPLNPYPLTWIPIAVFDWQWEFSKAFSGTTSWTDPNGSCNVTVSFNLWDIIQKMTAFGYNERNLNKNDVLVLRCIDNERDQNPNELVYAPYSNFVQINYTDLPLKY
jgi:hypothetical protein